MEFELKGNVLKFNRVLSNLDKLVIKFAKVLSREKIDYVIISGYIAILFGRSRNTEDVDLFIEEMPFEKFAKFWAEVYKQGFECINTPSPEEAHKDFLQQKLAIRFAEKDFWEPNFEIKYPKNKYNRYSLHNKIKVLLCEGELNTSEIEMQIAFKLKLGSEKDFEDARHLYKFFKEYLNIGLLQSHIMELMVEKEARKIL